MGKKLVFLFLGVLIGYTLGYETKEIFRDRLYKPFLSNFKPIDKELRTKRDLKEYKEYKECPNVSFKIFTFGQSNMTNSVEIKSSIQIPTTLFQYDWQSNKCYEYKEPLISTSGDGGNVITFTAAKLAKYSNSNILIIPVAINGTSVIDWAYGKVSRYHIKILKLLKENNLDPDLMIWHQGEGDNSFEHGGLFKKTYYDALKTILNRNNNFFPNTKFAIALATRCNSSEWIPVREAQQKIAESFSNAFISVDSDKIYGNNLRYDDCHFSSDGAKQLGNEYYLSIQKNFPNFDKK